MKIIEFKNFFKIIGIYGLQVIYVLFTNLRFEIFMKILNF